MSLTHPASLASSWLDRSTIAIRWRIAGPDRARCLHNLTTQDIHRLTPGTGAEAFITSPQGKTLAYVRVLATPETLLLRTEADSFAVLEPHLRKYSVFDDVEIQDLSPSTFEYHLVGIELQGQLARIGIAAIPEGPDLSHVTAEWKGQPLFVVREQLGVDPGITLIGPSETAEDVRSAFDAAGFRSIDEAAFEALRIRGGIPRSGRDVTPDNLPQEIGRDAQAISFQKGCYLGQETVARLDALGHVNKLLKGLVFPGLDRAFMPPVGAGLRDSEGKDVGRLTSVSFDEQWGMPVALGFVRVRVAAEGTSLTVDGDGGPIPAVVTALPMKRPGISTANAFS